MRPCRLAARQSRTAFSPDAKVRYGDRVAHGIDIRGPK